MDYIDNFTVKCTWMQEIFSVLLQDANEETIRRYAKAYIMMLLSTQLFGDKSGTCMYLRWLPYVARLKNMGRYSWGSVALSWLYRCLCCVANKNVVKLAGPLQLLQSWIFKRFLGFKLDGFDAFHWPLAMRWLGYQLTLSEKGHKVTQWRLFTWMPYSAPKVVQVVHPEILETRHMALWRVVTTLIYFAVIEWHRVDRVLPQFGGV
ncbi:protein MAIN-LIKE 1-like [Arachis hypogaea]|uniref:protein MAIN-LIKE 1-like n=1 Tax=Arachis hypogaea TaxID=3818 RepID=UPI003B21F6D4